MIRDKHGECVPKCSSAPSHWTRLVSHKHMQDEMKRKEDFLGMTLAQSDMLYKA